LALPKLRVFFARRSMQEPRREQKSPDRPDTGRSEFLESLKTGMLIGAALLVVIIPAMRMAHKEPVPQPQVAAAPHNPAPSGTVPSRPVIRLADFKGEEPSAEARLVANWVLTTGNAHKHAFVLVDKKDARVYVFGPEGRLKDSAPALLGAARGDDSFPGIGDKPLSAVRPEEKTTPAGRFVAEPGRNASNEDIVWVSYDLAVSMHRVRPLVARERRLERLATLSTDDNRISFGCINLPVTFYEDVLRPAVQKYGAIVYVLPEVKSPQEVFGAFDVNDPAEVAAAQARAQKTAAAVPSNVHDVALQTAR
jgi:hypothetical protein